MNWLRRSEQLAPSAAPAPDRSVPGRVERAMPGVTALLAGLPDDPQRAILDLGTATDASLQTYRHFARWVRFGDLLSAADSEEEWAGAVASIPAHPERPYDIVFAWNVLDRIAPAERPGVVARLAELTAPGARLYIVVQPAAEGGLRHPLRFALTGLDSLRFEPVGRAVAAWPPLLPAELERLIVPFHVDRAFTTQVGLREYVAIRRNR